MTTPLPPLLDVDDLGPFQASDPEYFAAAAGEMVRAICQWHIAPSITETRTVGLQPNQAIMLPSLHVTDVAEIVINGITIDPSTYYWDEKGGITRFHEAYLPWPLYPLQTDQQFRPNPIYGRHHATVTFTHGYDDLPLVVKTVALELATRAMELPAGLATSITAGPQTISLGALGVVANADDRRKLGPWTLVRF